MFIKPEIRLPVPNQGRHISAPLHGIDMYTPVRSIGVWCVVRMATPEPLHEQLLQRTKTVNYQNWWTAPTSVADWAHVPKVNFASHLQPPPITRGGEHDLQSPPITPGGEHDSSGHRNRRRLPDTNREANTASSGSWGLEAHCSRG